MKHQRFWGFIIVATLAIFVAISVQPASAQYPNKKITMIVPYRAGGGFDLQARMLAMHMEKYLPNKVNVVVENVSGAGGKIGATQLAKSKPDGYTIACIGLEMLAFMQSLGQLEQDPMQLTFLGQLSSDPLLLTANASSGLKTMADFKGRDVRYGVTGEMLPSAAVISKTLGSKYRPVLFDGSGDAILAGVRGDADAVVLSWPTMMKGVRDSQGKLISLCVLSKSRLAALPNVPTLAELGVQAEPGLYAVVATSRILAGPNGMDKAAEGILIDAINKAERDPEFVSQMKKAQFEILASKPDEVRANMKEAIVEFTAIKDLVKSYIK